MTPYIYVGLTANHRIRFKLSTIRKQSVVKSPETRSEINYYAEHILKMAANHFQVTETQLKSKSREGEIVEARQIAMYAIKSNCIGSTLKGIGKLFNRDHSTVLYSIDTVNNVIQTNKKYKRKVTDFLNSL